MRHEDRNQLPPEERREGLSAALPPDFDVAMTTKQPYRIAQSLSDYRPYSGPMRLVKRPKKMASIR